MKNEIEVWRNL